MKHFFLLYLAVLFTVDSYATTNVGVVKQYKMGEQWVFDQIISKDWDARVSDKACITTGKVGFRVINPINQVKSFCDGGKYKSREWSLMDNAQVVDRGLSLVVETSGNCSRAYQTPIAKEYVLPASEVRYIDIEDLQKQFKIAVLEWILWHNDGNPDVLNQKDISYALANAKLKIQEFKKEGNSSFKLHYAQLIIGNSPSYFKEGEIPIADFWVKLGNATEPVVLKSRMLTDNYIKAKVEKRAQSIKRDMIGPFFGGDRVYFINEDQSRYSYTINLFSVYQYSGDDSLSLEASWKEGC